ncbi:hypothetical protein BDZ89DRAFT_1005796 [Hymenopellis radicata]|nr:hypothetical protein BDZ89DRAFT_1005796 [Hymenopellis radicata]
MGGRNSSFTMNNGTDFQWQHDARIPTRWQSIWLLNTSHTMTPPLQAREISKYHTGAAVVGPSLGSPNTPAMVKCNALHGMASLKSHRGSCWGAARLLHKNTLRSQWFAH